jgi:zinc protease
MVIASALALVLGCTATTDGLNIGADGYGRTTLANGITVLVNHDETTSLSSARFLIGGGVLTETTNNNGITNLMTRMLLKGNETMDGAAVTEELDFLGASFSANCYRDYSTISFTTLTENFDRVMEIVSQSLMTPTFAEDELAKLKQEVEGQIKASSDNQSAAASKLFWRTAYGDRGYGLPTLGTIESIQGITADDLRQHYQKYVGGANIIFSVATDLPADQLMSIVESRLGGLKTEADAVPAPSLAIEDEKNGFMKFDRDQSFVYMGVVLDHLTPDQVAYAVLLDEIMGNNVGSRLWYLRQDEKLAYSVYTQYQLDRFGAIFRAAIGTDTSKVQQALSSLNREWATMVGDGITEEELTDARVNMKNNLIYSIDRKSNRANNMAYYEYIGYNYRFIFDLIEKADRVALADLNSFVQTSFTDDRRFVAVVGKQ